MAVDVTEPLERFRLDYAPLLLRYLTQRDETGLQAAYQLGRDAMRESLSRVSSQETMCSTFAKGRSPLHL